MKNYTCADMLFAIFATGLSLCIAVFVTCSIVGCSRRYPSPPAIEVIRVDTPENTGVTIWFKHFYSNNNGDFYVALESPEEIAKFREQLEFATARLEEAEKRVNLAEKDWNAKPITGE